MNYKTSSNRVIWSPLPPPKKKDSNKLIWSEPFTAFSNWFNSNRNRNNYCVCGAKCAVYLLPICILPQLELIPHTTNKNTTNNYVSFNIMQQRIQAIEQLSSLHLINLFGWSSYLCSPSVFLILLVSLNLTFTIPYILKTPSVTLKSCQNDWGQSSKIIICLERILHAIG